MHRIVVNGHDLDRRDRVRALGNDASGRDLHRLALGQRALGRVAGGDPPHECEHAGHVRRADGIAVHRRAREWREIDLGASGLCGDPARGLGERDRLGGEQPAAREHQSLRLVDGE